MKTVKIFLIAGCAVGVIVLGGAGYLLYDGIRGLREQSRSLDKALSTRVRYYRHDPFPSPVNVGIENDNAVAIEGACTNLLARLAEGQIDPPQLTPSTFMRLLGTKQLSLKRAAEEGKQKDFRTRLPEGGPGGYAFGFEPYFAGAMRPKPEHVRELTRQLLILERLFRVLFEEGVEEVLSVGREEFESGGAERAAAKKQTEEAPLYRKQHFSFTFRAGEAALLSVLNRLAADRMFVVVTSVGIRKEASDILQVMAREEDAPAAGRVLGIAEMLGTADMQPGGKSVSGKPARKPEEMLRDERVVCGDRVAQPVTVMLEVDVYRFGGE